MLSSSCSTCKVTANGRLCAHWIWDGPDPVVGLIVVTKARSSCPFEASDPSHPANSQSCYWANLFPCSDHVKPFAQSTRVSLRHFWTQWKINLGPIHVHSYELAVQIKEIKNVKIKCIRYKVWETRILFGAVCWLIDSDSRHLALWSIISNMTDVLLIRRLLLIRILEYWFCVNSKAGPRNWLSDFKI